MKDLIVIILSELSHYLESLVGLLSGPKTFVRTLYENNDKSLIQSFTFLGVSFVLYSLLLSGFLPTDIDFLKRTATHGIYVLMSSLIGVGILQLSWRIVRGRGPFNKLYTIMLYYDGVGLLISGACLLLSLGSITSLHPKLFKPLISALILGKSEAPLKYVNSLIEEGKLVDVVILMGLWFIHPISNWIWTYISWGAFRELNLTSKRASAIAFVVFFILHNASLPLLYFIAKSLTSSYEK